MKKDDKKQPYILCPRCELNYIKAKEKYCTVCKAEMGMVDPSVLLPDEEEAGLEKLCPVCHVNYIGEDEEICFLCQKEREEHAALDAKDEWAELDNENTVTDIDAPIGILPLDDEPILGSDEEAEEEEEPERVEDDFDYPDVDDDFDDEDFDDEDEEDDFDDEE